MDRPSTFATGTLGPTSFGLGFWDSFAVILIANFVFSWLVAFFGCLGPKTGLRTITIGRFALGIWGTRVLVILNLCGMVGWSSVNSISGAQVLTALTNNKCPLWAGNLIISVVTGIIGFFGYESVHWFERICWVPQLIVFIFLAGYGAKSFDGAAIPMGSGNAEAAGVMSFMASVYGFVAGWAGSAADYSAKMPVGTSQKKLAISLWAGNFFSCVFVQVLGAAFMTAVKVHPAYAHAYDSNGAGGVMGVALEPIHGFGKFLLTLLALSIIGCNLVNV